MFVNDCGCLDTAPKKECADRRAPARARAAMATSTPSRRPLTTRGAPAWFSRQPFRPAGAFVRGRLLALGGVTTACRGTSRPPGIGERSTARPPHGHDDCTASGMTALHAAPGSPAEAPEHLVELLRAFDTAMLITRPSSGALRARPMSLAEIEPDGTLWFLTSASSPKAQELSEDSRAMVTLQKATRFVALNGDMEFVTDRARIHQLWKVTDAAWFQDADDPDIVLLRFSPVDAEYWDNAGTRGLRYAFEIAKAVIQKEPMGASATVPAAHAKVAR